MGKPERGLARGVCWGAFVFQKAAIAIPKCHKCAFQNSIFRVCGGGSPLADTMGTLQVLSSGLALTTQLNKRMGGKGCQESPPAWLVGHEGLTTGHLSARKPLPWILPWFAQSAMQKRTHVAPLNTFLLSFKSRNSDIAVWWLGGVWLATNCYVKIMLGVSYWGPAVWPSSVLGAFYVLSQLILIETCGMIHFTGGETEA